MRKLLKLETSCKMRSISLFDQRLFAGTFYGGARRAVDFFLDASAVIICAAG